MKVDANEELCSEKLGRKQSTVKSRCMAAFAFWPYAIVSDVGFYYSFTYTD